jgi:hypothetical protein
MSVFPGISGPTYQRPFDGFADIDFPPADLPNAEALIWTPPSTGAEIYYVWFYLCEYGGVGCNVTLGRDYGAGGGLGAGEFWLNTFAIGANSTLDWRGPFPVRGADRIRGDDGGAGGNVICCHLRIKRVQG